MLDYKNYEETYDQLRGISEYEADLFAGRAYKQMLTDAGLAQEDSLYTGTEMQCAAVSTGEHMEQTYADREDKTQSEILTKFAENVLREKLAPFSEQEKKTLMISMLDASRSALNEPLDEWELVQLRLKENPDIEKMLTAQILKAASRAWGETDPEDWETEQDKSQTEQDEPQIQSDTFSEGAAMGAAYLQDETLRDCPEMIGIVTGASCTLQKQWDMEKVSDNLDWISMMLMLLAISIIVSLLFCTAYGVGITAIDSLITGTPTTLFEEVCFVLKECVQVYAFQLKLALGTAVAGLAVKAASMLCLANAKSTAQNIELPSEKVTTEAQYLEETVTEQVTADAYDLTESAEKAYDDDEYDDDYDYA